MAVLGLNVADPTQHGEKVLAYFLSVFLLLFVVEHAAHALDVVHAIASFGQSSKGIEGQVTHVRVHVFLAAVDDLAQRFHALGDDGTKALFDFHEGDVVVFHHIMEHDHLQQDGLVLVAQPLEGGCVQGNFNLVLKFGRYAILAHAHMVFLGKGDGTQHIHVVSTQAVALQSGALSFKSKFGLGCVFVGHGILLMAPF